MAIFNLLQTVWKTEKIPSSWYNSTLTQLSKGKRNESDLDNKRFIHDKNELMKVLGQLVMEKAKENLLTNMTKFQIACKPGHRASEHLFVLKSVFALYQSRGKPLIVTTFDVYKVLRFLEPFRLFI